jgi:hypothetical protein
MPDNDRGTITFLVTKLFFFGHKKNSNQFFFGMATYFANIDLSKIVIGATETGNNGNEYKQIAYNGQQLKNVQLGNGVLDLIRCPFGVEAVSAKQTDKFCVKIDASPTLASFFNEIDQRVIASVDDPTMTHRSPLKTNGNYATLKIKIQSDTQISTTEFVDDKKNKISAFKTGTNDDSTNHQVSRRCLLSQGRKRHFFWDVYRRHANSCRQKRRHSCRYGRV